MNINIWDGSDPLQELIRQGHAGKTVDPARLADPRVPLGDVLT
jgi:3-phenylpropionate/trans-cinnamate dioxygenase ferredoxin reductase subunit